MGGIQYMGIIVVNEMDDEERQYLADIHRAASRAEPNSAEEAQEQNVQDISVSQPTTPILG